MPLKLSFTLEKTEEGKYNVEIGCDSTDGEKHGFVTLLQDDPIEAVCERLKTILVLSPNLNQDEFTKNYNAIEWVELPD